MISCVYRYQVLTVIYNGRITAFWIIFAYLFARKGDLRSICGVFQSTGTDQLSDRSKNRALYLTKLYIIHDSIKLECFTAQWHKLSKFFGLENRLLSSTSSVLCTRFALLPCAVFCCGLRFIYPCHLGLPHRYGSNHTVAPVRGTSAPTLKNMGNKITLIFYKCV